METTSIDERLARFRQLGGPQLVVELIDLFLETVPERLEDARAGAGGGDLAAVARSMHALKSSAGNLGAAALQRIAVEIESFALNRDGPSVAARMPDLEAAFGEARRLLEQRKGGPA